MKHLKFILSNLILCMLLASYTACSSDNDSGDEPTNPIEKSTSRSKMLNTSIKNYLQALMI